MTLENKVWIFGLGMAAECVAHEIGVNKVAGFCANEQYVNRSDLLRLPVVPYEEIGSTGPGTPVVFVAAGYSDLNRTRRDLVEKLRSDGVNLYSVIPDSLFSSLISFGPNCFLMSGCNIQPYVTLGSNVFVWSGATICHHCKLGSNIWVTAGATIAGNTLIGDNVFIGANATIVSGIKLGSNVFIGAGAVVVKDVPDNGVVIARADSLAPFESNFVIKFLEHNGNY